MRSTCWVRWHTCRPFWKIWQTWQLNPINFHQPASRYLNHLLHLYWSLSFSLAPSAGLYYPFSAITLFSPDLDSLWWETLIHKYFNCQVLWQVDSSSCSATLVNLMLQHTDQFLQQVMICGSSAYCRSKQFNTWRWGFSKEVAQHDKPFNDKPCHLKKQQKNEFALKKK